MNYCILEKVKNRKCTIAGDFNYNLLNISHHNKTEDYFNILLANSFKPLITKPTRITESSQTLIDHIWTNDIRTERENKSYIYITDMSDHLPCIAVLPTEQKQHTYITQFTRNYSDENKEKFREQIKNNVNILKFHCTNSHTNLQTKTKEVNSCIL